MAVLRTIYSIAVTGVIALSMLAIAVPAASAVAGACCLVALVVSMPLVRRGQRVIALVLVGAGIAFLCIAVALGHEVAPRALLQTNQDLVAMLVAVSLLGFVARITGEVTPRLSGTPAVLRTLGLTHLLGGFINISAVTVVADQLRTPAGLRPAEVQIITRGFTSAAFWSPFWAGAAIALSMVPGANVGLVMLVGIPLALVVLLATTPTILRAFGPELPSYRGYALSWALLRVPVALAATLLVLHLLLPATPMPRLIALSAVGVTAVWAALPRIREFPTRFWAEVRRAVPGSTGETSLFVSAGVMAIGLGMLMAELEVGIPLEAFTVPVAWVCIVVMVLGVFIGVHQIITIGLIAAVVLPLQPDPTLFMAAVMIGWGAAIALGPIAGMQLYLQGRYGVNSLVTVRQNLPYLLTILALAWPALLLIDLLV